MASIKTAADGENGSYAGPKKAPKKGNQLIGKGPKIKQGPKSGTNPPKKSGLDGLIIQSGSGNPKAPKGPAPKGRGGVVKTQAVNERGGGKGKGPKKPTPKKGGGKIYAGGSTFNESTGRHERPDGTPIKSKNKTASDRKKIKCRA